MARGLPQGDILSPLLSAIVAIQRMLSYHFMQNALLAGALVALAAGALSCYVVLRGQSFASHALANVGFAGASGAPFLAVLPFVGLLGASVLAALAIGWLGERRTRGRIGQEVAIGTTLAFALGAGLFFARASRLSNAQGVYALLFGSILGVTDQNVRDITLVALVTLLALVVVARPLLFASLDPEVARARGIPIRALDYGFLALVAFTVAEAAQVVGVLLIFALLVTPGATALRLTTRPWRAIPLAAGLALLVTWLGLIVAYFSPYPVGFFITTFAFGLYLTARLIRRRHSATPLSAPPSLTEAGQGA